MVAHFDQMGVVSERPGVADSPDFPGTMQVSDRPLAPSDTPDRRLGSVVSTANVDTTRSLAKQGERRTDLSQIAKVRRFPHGLR
jgi:hypothetical protein